MVQFSQTRIHGRTQPSKLKTTSPLYQQVERLSKNLSRLPDHSTQLSDLQAALASLVDCLKKVDTNLSNVDLSVLKDVVRKSYEVSNQGESRSLEKNPYILKLEKEVPQSRVVLEIDKLSKYFGLCKDLIHYGCQPQTRKLWQNLKLEPCTSYPRNKPHGAERRCFVHGEVQLILFYERYPKQPPDLWPRAIGSSKSACFLCDSFIRNYSNYRQFGVSHSHMQLYTQWTIPQATWMNADQIQRMKIIIRAIAREVQILRKDTFYIQSVIQSRAFILQVESSSNASSIVSSQLTQKRLSANQAVNLQKVSPMPSLGGHSDSIETHKSLCNLRDLPITIRILPSTLSCTLLCEEVCYIFDLEEVQQGQLLVQTPSTETEAGYQRVDVRQLTMSLPMRISSKETHGSISFSVHDANKHEIYMTFIWVCE